MSVGGPGAAWARGSVNRSILAGALTVGCATALVKLVALVKEGVVASRFGTQAELDAFLIAYLLPAYAVTLVGNSFALALVPVFVRERERAGDDAARSVAASVQAWVLLGLAATSVAVALAG